MDERLLQFIWQQQYFNNIGLSTTSGEWLTIISPGRLNTDQGPDFLESRIRLGGLEWRGTIELHVRTSDWLRHRHEQDPHYGNVILHVVWEHDHASDQRAIPVLELKGRVPTILLEQYRAMMWQPAQIPCETQLTRLPSLHWHAWKDRLLTERMMSRSRHIIEWLQQTGGHWEEVCWWLLARNFGVRLNSDVFEQIARSIPLRIIARHKQQLVQLEALLFGRLLEVKDVKEVRSWFNVTANDYWHYHFRLDEPATYQVKHLGEMMQENIVINTVAPLLFAYGEYHRQPVYQERAVRWLEASAPENNRHSKLFARLGRKPLHAGDSQAMIELKEQYCDQRRCLDCAVGNYLLKQPIDADNKPK